MNPVGSNVSAGIGVGMMGYDFSPEAGIMAALLENAIITALSGNLNASTLKPIGIHAMAGLAAGIRVGQVGMVSAMRAAARSAVNAAKQELKIASPSGVFRDEVGRYGHQGLRAGRTAGKQGAGKGDPECCTISDRRCAGWSREPYFV